MSEQLRSWVHYRDGRLVLAWQAIDAGELVTRRRRLTLLERLAWRLARRKPH